jgi:acyl-CoA reductase-like NAD-dependent aldehyde dehydrogenase
MSSTSRVPVAKTYKLYLGGAFPRSESGRSYPVRDAGGALLAHAALASRKDVRDAVSAARAALPGWAGTTAYNRGQVLYRVAEMLEGRRRPFVGLVAAAEADPSSAPRRWSTRPSTAGSGTRAGPTRSRPCWAR